MDKYEIEMLEKLDAGEKLTKREIRSLVFEFNEINRTNGDNGRWSRSVTTIVEIGGRYFCINWEEGLTENQENEFYVQPYEVEKKTYEKIITVTDWVKKENLKKAEVRRYEV